MARDSVMRITCRQCGEFMGVRNIFEALLDAERRHTATKHPGMRSLFTLTPICLTCGGQGFIGDGGYVACPTCTPSAS